VFVFDDLHVVDDSPDVKEILRELLGRGPERMSFVFASRREPPIRLARLRALGEVAELDTDDLRFDAMKPSGSSARPMTSRSNPRYSPSSTTAPRAGRRRSS
jgi:LuxR family maltose regulon positive regulatory protein